MPRQPILSVLGHVDSGKTTLLDKIRESKITDGESGGITQMIGATEVPIETLEEVCGDLLKTLETELTIPGILFIDTPGHAAFSSLRKRGGSISDIAVLVVDINNGIQPQTKEAIEILKDSGTPFVVALNKVDTLAGWRSEERLFSKNVQKQREDIQERLDERIYELMADLHEYGYTADRFDRVDSFQEKVAMVPISAETGEGIPELLMVLTGLSQKYLKGQLEVHEGIGKGTVLEVSEEKGLGTTLDVIIYDGIARKSDKLVYGTGEGAKTTEIRALLQPRPLQEIRLDKQYNEVDEVKPAAGIKISGKDIEDAISGAPVRIASEENVEQAVKEVDEEIEAVEFETQTHGVIVKADSLGSLEAVMREIGDNINVQKAEVGPITKRDVVEAAAEEEENRAILAFNVGYTEQGEISARDRKVNVFRSPIIYQIVEGYEEWKQDLKQRKRKESLNDVARPARIRTMPEHVFRSSKPVVIGSKVLEGVLIPGVNLMTLKGERVGRVKAIQEKNESVEKAEKGSEVAVSIDGATLGRTFEKGDELLVDIPGQDYKRLKNLSDMLSDGEKKVMEDIVEIKDSIDPHWKLN